MNPFSGDPVFLNCVLDTFKCFYKQPFSFCLAKLPGFCMFHALMATYRNMNPFSGDPVFLNCVLETFECFYKQTFSFCLANFAWFLYV